MKINSHVSFIEAMRKRIVDRHAETHGLTLKQWRADNGYTLKRLSIALNVSLSAVNKWEGGDREPIGFLGYALSALKYGLPPVDITSPDSKNPQIHLATWRKEFGFTQEELAEKLDINLYTVKKWEGGSRESIDFLGLALAAVEADLKPVKVIFERRTQKLDEEMSTAPKL